MAPLRRTKIRAHPSGCCVYHELTLTPVTALAFADDLLLAGEGPFLRVYDRARHSCVLALQLFESQAIHGIAVQLQASEQLLVLVWGGRLLLALALQLPKPVKFVRPHTSLTDGCGQTWNVFVSSDRWTATCRVIR